MKRALVIDAFARRQFDKSCVLQARLRERATDGSASYVGTSLVGVSEEALEAAINARYAEVNGELQPGYAPFCKHLFVPNTFASIKSGVVEITAANEPLMQSAYEARTEKELPVLQRWLNAKDADVLPQAKWLDVILYSREQIRAENAAMGMAAAATDAPWGVISVKGQDVDRELPMTPITMMRNALGKDEGGSGVPLDRAAYVDAVAFWRKHVTVR